MIRVGVRQSDSKEHIREALRALGLGYRQEQLYMLLLNGPMIAQFADVPLDALPAAIAANIDPPLTNQEYRKLQELGAMIRKKRQTWYSIHLLLQVVANHFLWSNDTVSDLCIFGGFCAQSEGGVYRHFSRNSSYCCIRLSSQGGLSSMDNSLDPD